MKVHKVISTNRMKNPTRAQIVVLIRDKFKGANGRIITTQISKTCHVRLMDAEKGIWEGKQRRTFTITAEQLKQAA
jgi:hypothetical protein